MQARVLFCLFFIEFTHAKDFGVRGEVYAIEEIDGAEYMAKHASIQEQLKFVNKKLIARAKAPLPVVGLKPAIENRTFYYDPSYSENKSQYDHKGQMFYQAGTMINPLDFNPFNQIWIFIHGSNMAQLKYAFSYKSKLPKHIILVDDSPLELEKKYNHKFWFDQKGVLTSKLKIKATPAVVVQDGRRLKIREIKLKKGVK